MTKCIKYLKLSAVLITLMGFYPSVSAQSSLTLHDSLTAAIEKQSNSAFIMLNDEDESYVNWLDGSPSVSLLRLESQQSLGTTESEISLNLPIKSPVLRQIEKTLVSKVKSLRTSAQEQYALYLSGLIRNILWELELEKVSVKALTQKQQMLSELATQYKEMADTQAIPQYVSLIVQNEFNQHKISSVQHQQNINNLRDKYFRLTGLYILPDDIKEIAPKLDKLDINLHPDVLALDAVFESAQQQLLSASKQTTPWNVQITGKRVNTPSFSENQLGIGIQIPINIGKNLSSVQQSEYLKITTEHTISRQKLLYQLTEVQASLSKEYDFLQQKQRLLNKGLPILHSLSNAMVELREANAPNQEFYIRTLLNTIDSEQNVELNLLYIQRHIALIRQAAGITL